MGPKLHLTILSLALRTFALVSTQGSPSSEAPAAAPGASDENDWPAEIAAPAILGAAATGPIIAATISGAAWTTWYLSATYLQIPLISGNMVALAVLAVAAGLLVVATAPLSGLLTALVWRLAQSRAPNAYALIAASTATCLPVAGVTFAVGLGLVVVQGLIFAAAPALIPLQLVTLIVIPLLAILVGATAQTILVLGAGEALIALDEHWPPNDAVESGGPQRY